MTVQELIDELQKIEDKTKPIFISYPSEVEYWDYNPGKIEYVCEMDTYLVIRSY